MARYDRYLRTGARSGATPQMERAAPNQQRNNSGGYTFVLDEWAALDRWLVLGAEGGTYYCSARALTHDNALTVRRCLDLDGPATVARIVELSESGRAPKVDPAIFALAMAAGHPDLRTRRVALDALPRVCRTGSHLLSFLDTVGTFRGWGRGLRRAVCRWYLDRAPHDLAYQVVKYQQRGGMSHRDALRLAGGALAKLPVSDVQAAILRWVVAGSSFGPRVVTRRSGPDRIYGEIDPASVPAIITGLEAVKAAPDVATVVRLIDEHRLTHEMVPNEVKGSPDVWAALLEHMPMTAMLRNLARLSALGLVVPDSEAAHLVEARLSDRERLQRARVHPLALLVALTTYRRGAGVRGSLRWSPVPSVIRALDAAFYMSFGLLRPTGRKRLVALDVSGSMGAGTIAGLPGITPRVGSAAMAMTTLRTESDCEVVAFTRGDPLRPLGNIGSGIEPLDLSADLRLDEVIARTSALPFGGTDCALPMLWAAERRREFDAIEIYTDNETWAGNVHPHEALQKYRQKTGRGCTLCVVGMTATRFSIADPSDAGMLDIVGFDTAAPSLMADFIRKGYGSPNIIR